MVSTYQQVLKDVLEENICNATRWTSMYTVIKYHKVHLSAEKSFPATELESAPHMDFLDFVTSKYKFLLIECNLVEKRAGPMITAMQLFESDLSCSFLLNSLIEKVGIELHSQATMCTEYFDEVMDDMTETFTSNEKEILYENVRKSSSPANEKFLMCFDDHDGKHPAKKMLKELEFLYPVKALAFEVHPSLSIFTELHIPVSEFADYRTQCRTFVSRITPKERYEITAMENEIQQVIDFWSASQSNLPGLFSAVQMYGFLTGSSAFLVRAIS